MTRNENLSSRLPHNITWMQLLSSWRLFLAVYVRIAWQYLYFPDINTSLIAHLVKNPPAMPETWVRSLGWKDPLEKGTATHFSILAWRILWTSMGSLRVRHNWATSLSFFTLMHWRRKWQPTPVFLPGASQGQGSLVGCCLWDHRVGYDRSDLAIAVVAYIVDRDIM